MQIIDSISTLNNKLALFEGSSYTTNAYFFQEEINFLIESKALYYDLYDSNLLLYKHRQELGFFEVYYYLKDVLSPFKIANDEPFVMEIPYRGVKNYPSKIIEFWQNSGFVTHINRDLLGLIKPNRDNFNLSNPQFDYKFVDKSESIAIVYESIKKTFDTFTGDILSLNEVISALNNKEIIGSYKNQKLTGFIRFYTKNKVSWIGHLVVLPNYMGQGIGKSLVAKYLELRCDQGFNNFQQWVVSNNDAALKLYSHFGFKSTNKCSISLIKK